MHLSREGLPIIGSGTNFVAISGEFYAVLSYLGRQALRKARGLTQVQLAEDAGTTQRAISYYETEAGFPPAPAVIDLAKALKVTTDKLLGLKAPKVERGSDDSEARPQWKKFRMVSSFPERD